MFAQFPPWLEWLKAFAAPIATIIASCVAAYFVRQQWRTAEKQAETAIDQLRWNLFSKRYAIYNDVKQLLKLLLNDTQKPNFSPFDAAQHYVVMDEAVFFFSPEICGWLESLQKDCQNFLEVNAARGTAEYDTREYARLTTLLLNHFRDMPERFRTELSFRQLTQTPTQRP